MVIPCEFKSRPSHQLIAGSMLPAMSFFFLCQSAARALRPPLAAGRVLCYPVRPRGAVFLPPREEKGAAAHRGGTFVAKQENDLGRDAIGKLVLRIAVPSMLAQFVSVLYSIVDRMYIGNIPVVGDVALAGVGVCGPVVTMVGSVAFLIGVGGAPLMSIKLGEKDEAGARRIMANCFLMLCVSSVALMAAIYPLARPMLLLFGASEATLPYAMAYFTTYLLGTPFALMATGLNQLIVCQGFARAGMKSILLGAVLNIVLDPVFIFALDMGVRGGALATVLSQMASCAYAVWFLLFSRRAMDNVMIIAMNALLQRYGGAAEGDMLVTCATIAQSFMLVVTMPLSGITGGTQSILGYNYGACNMARVKQAVRTVARLCMGYALVMTLAGFAAGGLFARLFTRDAAVLAEAARAIRICVLAIVPLGVQYEIVDGFTALGQAQIALPLSFWRKAVYFAALFALPALFGARAIFYAEPVSDVLGPAVSAAAYLLFMDQLLQRRQAAAGTRHWQQGQDAAARGWKKFSQKCCKTARRGYNSNR